MTSGYAGFTFLFAVSIISLAFLGRKIIVKQGRPSDFGTEKQEEVAERKPVEEEAGPPEKQEEVSERKPVGEEAGPSTATPEKGCFKFDVFISFRGEDTRKGFTSHLYKELDTRGITAFIDSEDLEKGGEISILFEHIERSKIFAPVFSQNYADSKWCLKEIAKMVEINKREGRKRPIIPIFYHVDQSDISHYRKSFGKAFEKHHQDKELREKDINEWKAALTEVGNVSGFDLPHAEWTEADIITRIANGVSDILCEVPFHIQPIGRDSCIKNLKQMLEKEKYSVRMIGICGMGGIGKTTLAMALYNEFFHTFEDCCFLSDIRENVKGEGLLSLQKKLIESILKESLSTGDDKQKVSTVKERLGSKKVLLVLDDVNDNDQLEALTGDRGKECFGAGSKIIATTRDKKVLLQHGLQKDDIYLLEGLNMTDSLKLFHKHAFDEGPQSEELEGLSREVVDAAQGLPLALTEFGSLFYGLEEKQEWEEELKTIKMDQQKKLHERLKISYDDLDDYEKCVFLDIACFFIGNKKEYPVYMWEACNYSPTATLEVLQHKSLIKVNENDEFEMHDQIRDMGRRIVKEEGNFDPLTYSRLWRKSQVLGMLADAKVSMGNPDVQGIDIHKVGDEAIEMSWKVIEEMQSLRMIIGANDDRCFVDQEEIIRFPSNLRWFNWNNCPYKTLAFYNDRHEKIRVLELTSGHFLDFRSHSMAFPNLKVLDLSGCWRLIRTPDFTHFPSLEKLVLDECCSLTKIDESIGHLKELVELSMVGCMNISVLPDFIGSLDLTGRFSLEKTFPNLKVLNLSGCWRLVRTPDFTHFPSLQKLLLDGCCSLTKIDESIGHLKELVELSMVGCEQISVLPDSITFPKLKVLDLSWCSHLIRTPDFTHFPSLQKLVLDKCWSLTKIDESIGHLKELVELSMVVCVQISVLPDSIAFPNLKVLNLSGCCCLIHTPGFTHFPSLQKLVLDGCRSLTKIDESIRHLKELVELSMVGCEQISVLPDSITFPNLKVLDLSGCWRLTRTPDFTHFPSLQKLVLDECCSLTKIDESIKHLKELVELSMAGCEQISVLSDSIGSLQSLEKLNLTHCFSLEKVPDSICGLKSLSDLSLQCCYLLKQLPSSMGMLPSLRELKIDYCKSLREVPDSLGDLNNDLQISLVGCTWLEKLHKSTRMSANHSDEKAGALTATPEKGCYDFDVFISFRGEDVRKGFVGHLKKALIRCGITAFIDSEDLIEEEFSDPFEHIEGSNIFVPVLSKGYAKSKTCLREITKMVEINKRERGKRPIIPVFYDVEPSDVKHCRASFSEAFQEHQSHKEMDEEQINGWKAALTEAGNISGFCLSDVNGNEAEQFTCLSKRVFDILCKVPFDLRPYWDRFLHRYSETNVGKRKGRHLHDWNM